MRIILLVLGLTFAAEAFSDNVKKEFTGIGLKELVVENGVGHISIAAAKDGVATVIAKKIDFPGNCKLSIERTGDKLSVGVKDTGWFNKSVCNVDFTITVPREIALDVKTGSGNIIIDGTHGALKFKLGSGDISANANVLSFDGKTGSGSINITGVVGNGSLKAGSGNITLTYKDQLKSGKLDVKIGSGDATLYMPTKMKISTNFKAESGSVYNELGDTGDASFNISMRAGSGNLNIKKL